MLHVPRDLMSAKVALPAQGPVRIAKAGPPADEDVVAIKAMIASAKRPVIFAGGGFKWADGAADLKALVETLQIPVVASTGHADVMPHGHPLFAGQGGPRGNSVASGLTRDADVILALGARLGVQLHLLFK